MPTRGLAFRALGLAGARRLLARRIRKSGAVAVLNLHSIAPESNPFWPQVEPSHFDAWLRRALRVFEFRTFRTLEEPSTKPIAVLSFDDGYLDFFEHAMPVLDRHGLTANLNVITGAVDEGRPPWNVRLYDWLTAASPRALRDPHVEGFSTRIEGDSKAAKQRFANALSCHLKLRSHAEREPLLAPLLERIDEAPPTRRMLTKTQVAEIARRHEIGSHSHSHDSMGFESDAYFQEDFLRSRAWLEKIGVPCDIYAFPNGSHRPEQVAWLEAQGVARVLLVEDRFARKGQRAIPRLTVAGGSVAELELGAMGLTGIRSLAPIP
jgi:peptidoglycan/xylan/chitin deacetylase (PgdA/CDA1 family)